MPTVSRFRNIKIEMYFHDHTPPHFHAKAGDHRAVCLLNGALHKGTLPSEVAKLVQQWAALRGEELRHNWNLCSDGQHPLPIPGLE